HLAHLALIAELIPHQQIFHDLLSDCRATLRATRLHEISYETADQRPLVDPVVLTKALVLGGDERLLHVGWNIDKVDPDPSLVQLIDLPNALTFGVEHLACAAQTPSLEPRMVGQVDHRSVIKFDHLFDVDGGAGNCLVLAELPVSDMQIGNLEPPKGCRPARHGLRVVHCGRDQIVKIESLEVEGASHLPAARAQQVDDILLLRKRIEGCPWLLPDCDLTEGQGNSEDLYENGVH